ncbi:MAG: phosphoribosylanthranilate isomerase [Polyangiales bacterium]
MTRVKICGVTSVADAQLCIDAGADALGLNFVPSSPRCLSLPAAAAIMAVMPAHVLSVGVFVDADAGQLRDFKATLGLGCLQLHGDEPPELLAEFLPHAYKALRVRGADVEAEAARYPGEYLLLDAYVPGVHGGSGARFDWTLALSLAQRRKLTLAGGLRPDNVADAVRSVQPFCVDVASGVESSPGKKDPALVRAFIQAAKSA